jgi:hypothetical protein
MAISNAAHDERGEEIDVPLPVVAEFGGWGKFEELPEKPDDVQSGGL